MENINVVKRDGEVEAFDVDKIKKMKCTVEWKKLLLLLLQLKNKPR